MYYSSTISIIEVAHITRTYIIKRSFMRDASKLKIGIENEIPESIVIGKGTALHISGWCSHPILKAMSAEITIADNKQQALLFHCRQPGDASSSGIDGVENSPSHTIFWSIVPIIQCDRERLAEVVLSVTLNDNSKVCKKLGEIKLYPSLPEYSIINNVEPSPPTNDPLIAIAMATYNPPINLFRKQIQSIISQSYTNWVCLISDDNSDKDSLTKMMTVIGTDRRFVISSTTQRLGFYRNFERCLTMVPQSAQYVALSDQDDYWYPDKLQTMLDYFNDNTSLVYCDMRVLDESDEVISDTFWSFRKNNLSDLGVQLVINSVTGAASIFTRRLLDFMLPFPQGIGNLHHDHWIGCVAMAVGSLHWIDRPLHDYIQHGQNVTGFAETPSPSAFRMIYDNLRALRTREGRIVARQIYFDHVPRISLMSQIIFIRCGSLISQNNLKSLHRLAHLCDSIKSVFWFCFRSLLSRKTANKLNGADYYVLLGILWGFIFGFNNFLKLTLLQKLYTLNKFSIHRK